jgi:NADP-dependent 3-hydroxy acid dehydrogenase YdfG
MTTPSDKNLGRLYKYSINPRTAITTTTPKIIIVNMVQVWLITGCSSGFGQEIALAALEHGDTVVATARDPAKLAQLAQRGAITEQLDVLDDDEKLSGRIEAIVKKTGGIDILVNNAGYILAGGVEECSRSEVEAQFNTNVFGQLNVIRAVLPVMRAKRSGVVANLGSIGGWHGTAAAGLYCATKACSTILAESLRQEVAHLNIEVTSIEPGYFRTNFLSAGHKTTAEKRIPDLAAGVEGTHAGLAAYDHNQPGDPQKGARVIVEALTGTGRCQGRELPVRLSLGSDAYKMVSGHIDRYKADLESWKDVTTTTDCDA